SSTRDSQDVSDPSTNRALRCLTCQSGRGGVCSALFARYRKNVFTPCPQGTGTQERTFLIIAIRISSQWFPKKSKDRQNIQKRDRSEERRVGKADRSTKWAKH